MRLTLRRATQRVARAIKPDFDQPDWRPILRASREDWREARRAARTGPGVLIATTVGGHPPSTTIESLLAVALTLRGARVHITLCDERLPACLRSHITAVESGPQRVIPKLSVRIVRVNPRLTRHVCIMDQRGLIRLEALK